MRVRILGSAAGGGSPQSNCRCDVCRLAWARDPRVPWRTQCSAAVSADGERWVLLNASPDLRQQMIARARGRSTFPQIFIGDHHVGGCDELHELEREGRLDALLETNGQG